MAVIAKKKGKKYHFNFNENGLFDSEKTVLQIKENIIITKINVLVTRLKYLLRSF